MSIKKQYYITLFLALAIYCVNIQWSSRGIRRDETGHHSAGPDCRPGENKYIGSTSCAACHKAIYESHLQTAHYKDSRPASAATIRGSLEGKKNHFTYNHRMEVVMEKKKDQFFQTAYFNGNVLQSEAFGIVVGSGRKGQSYLYWDSIRLFQLPVSWYAPSDSWCNSPGFPVNLINFSKQIHPQCMECHSTYAQTKEDGNMGTVFDKKSILYGIDCEKCHGPGAEHVAFHQSHPGEKIGYAIINAARLTRQQQLDACALCHSGLRQPIQPSFLFKTGDNLNDFSSPAYAADSTATLDVHANQYGLLTSSRCFQMSQMNCASCHDVHSNEVNSPQVFSARCMTCHNESLHSSCTAGIVRQQSLFANCIDCHMPLLPSNKILVQVSGSDSAKHDLVRTHRIGLYPGAVKEYLSRLHPSR